MLAFCSWDHLSETYAARAAGAARAVTGAVGASGAGAVRKSVYGCYELRKCERDPAIGSDVPWGHF